MADYIDINEYTYDLPPDRIALHPPARRGDSRLLVFRNDRIEHRKFTDIVDYLDDTSLLVVNDTRVIPARLVFTRPSGALIEVFLLSPVAPSPLVQVAMEARSTLTWRCAIGNLKKWKDPELRLTTGNLEVHARLIDRNEQLVSITWNDDRSFAEVIEAVGATPLPPYLKRDAVSEDRERYQTVYAQHHGAVAAPTAGLHITDELLSKLEARGITRAHVTLHVGAGTFMPVKASNAIDHVMHEEQVIVSRSLLKLLKTGRPVVAVGTTSMRVLESIYWFGCKLANDPSAEFDIRQDDPYGRISPLSLGEAISNVITSLGDADTISGRTSIFIRPGYKSRVVTSLITNFHQPGSTLMLLVAAFVGPAWKQIYSEAIVKEYRFLSYGDSSLLMPSHER